MSGPVTKNDTDVEDSIAPVAATTEVEVVASRTADVGGETVHRALPRRSRRTIGAWCFLDHFGPHDVTPHTTMQVGPHPHIGLHTVTWLLAGEVVHTDSLGSEQLIRPGQLNLMTAGAGVAHAEDGRHATAGVMHGVQLWVAQPESTRHGPAAFEHHAELPIVELGHAEATVLVGEFADARSDARIDTPLVGVDLVMNGAVQTSVDPTFEYGVVVLHGTVEVDGVPISTDELGYLGLARTELSITSAGPARLLLLGGAPFGESTLMWWNFVARTRDEIEAAYAEWTSGAARFGTVRSTLDPMPTPRPPWMA